MSNARFSILQAKAVKDKRISDSQFRTLAALGMYADEDGWCFPSLQTLGDDLGKSKQAVGRDTIALRKLGYLEVTGRFDKKSGSRHSNLYRLIFDTPRQPDVDAPSTKLVDAPSTSEVDVNDPLNEPNELQDVIDAANRKVDGYLAMSLSPGMKRMARVDAILSFLGGRLKVNTEGKRWREFATFADDMQQKKGQTVEGFISWLFRQKDFNVQYWPPRRMREFWPQAFVTSETLSQREGNSFYA